MKSENMKLNLEMEQLCTNLNAYQPVWPYYSVIESAISVERIIMKIDTKNIPPESKIKQAYINLNLINIYDENPSPTLKCTPIRGTFDSEDTFLHRFSKTKECLSRQQSKTYPVSLDITDILRVWVDYPKKNKGLLIGAPARDISFGICGDCECIVVFDQNEVECKVIHCQSPC